MFWAALNLTQEHVPLQVDGSSSNEWKSRKTQRKSLKDLQPVKLWVIKKLYRNVDVQKEHKNKSDGWKLLHSVLCVRNIRPTWNNKSRRTEPKHDPVLLVWGQFQQLGLEAVFSSFKRPSVLFLLLQEHFTSITSNRPVVKTLHARSLSMRGHLTSPNICHECLLCVGPAGCKYVHVFSYLNKQTGDLDSPLKNCEEALLGFPTPTDPHGTTSCCKQKPTRGEL